MKNTLLLVIGFFILGFSSVIPARAALDISVSPVFLNYSPKPGDTITDTVRLHNNTGAPVNLELSVSKMSVNDRGDIVPEEIAETDPTSKWIKFTAASITAPAREWIEIPVTIKIPADAAYGNYFALVFSAEGTKTGTAAVQGNILVPVLLNVKKDGSIAKADISGFSVKNFVSEFLPVEFNLTITNSGNLHLAPRGNIFIRGKGDKDLAVLEVNPNQSNILPNSSREFTSSWSDGFLVKNQSGGLDINWNKFTSFRLGKYTAYALLVYDDGRRDVPVESTITFWVFPYTALAIFVAVIILAVVILNLGFKAMVKKEAQKISTLK